MKLEFPLIGYGTLIYKMIDKQGDIHTYGVCIIYDYIRIFHKKLGYWYPFVLPKIGHKFKGILYDIRSKDFLNELDRYEGVPELYHRVKCNVNYKGKKIESWIYRPTDRTIEKLIKEIENLKEIDRKSIFNEDIWLRYLESEFPHVVKKYPELFMPIKSF